EPLRRLAPPDRRVAALAGWRAFSPMAAVSVGVLAATGVYEAGRHVDDLGAATESAYGTALLVKVLVLGVALGLAGYNTLVVNPGLAARVGRTVGLGPQWRPPRASLRGTVTAEAVVLLVAVGLAAVMTSVPTAREVTAASAVTVPHTDTVDGLFVTAETVPSGSDIRVVVRTEEVLRPMPWPVTGVDVALVEGTEVTPTAAPADGIPLGVVEPGRYEGSVADPGLAAWTAEVAVHRAGRPDVVLLVPGSSAVDRPVGPVELATGALALVLLLVTGTAVVVVRRRTTSPTSGTPTPSDVPSQDVPEVPLLQEASHR
ncbi:MAG TPA: CopD family protein, partial [Phycicoccus sp.]|nr:CopD family protein [Phycicoccus sp.]